MDAAEVGHQVPAAKPTPTPTPPPPPSAIEESVDNNEGCNDKSNLSDTNNGDKFKQDADDDNMKSDSSRDDETSGDVEDNDDDVDDCGGGDRRVVGVEEAGMGATLDDDDGDPIPSGTGSVSKDCSASELHGWSEVLPRWHSKLNQRPKGLDPLVRNGIPDPLRGEVWQLLSGAHQSSDLMERYRIFLTQSAPTEQIILRDIHRTYPAHENFRSGGGPSSLLDSLFKVCKAYAVYDEEVGYCQGLSFLVAALLLHMPEEQAFCVFVRIMQHYGLRNLFRNNFDELYLKFYQLEHLLEEHMPDLHQHFTKIGIEPFTYASQWFLTVFTAKFPLNAVFYIMDIFLLDGMNTIFQIALALLSSSKRELLALDFEGVLKYFRVQMPKRYRNQDNVQQLISASSGISLKKLKKHAKNYEIVKQKEKLLENPVNKLQREVAKLTENNLRLEQENDDLARDLVASKIQLRAQLDDLEDKTENLNRALQNSHQDCRGYLSTISDMEDEKIRLEVEVNQLKEVCRRELQRAETELARDSSIIGDYKKICSQLSKRLDGQIDCASKFIESVLDSLRDNGSCQDRLCHKVFQLKADEFLRILKSDDGCQQDWSWSAEDKPKLGTSDKVNSESEQSTTTTSTSNRQVGAYINKQPDPQSRSSSEAKLQSLSQHIDELEVELARTKLALVEAECKCQQLTHDLSVGATIRTGSNQSGLTGRLDFMKAAVSSSSRRTPKGATNAFAKINNLISERISNISTPQQPNNAANHNHRTSPTITSSMADNLPVSSSSSAISSISSPSRGSQLNDSSNSSKSSSTIDQCHDRC